MRYEATGTTWTAASGTSRRNRLMTEPYQRISQRDRRLRPKMTCVMPSRRANAIRPSAAFAAFTRTTVAPSRSAREIVITAIGFLVTIAFDADVNAQGGAYATGVLVLMTSAAIAVTIAIRKGRAWFALITLVFVSTTVVNIIERPEGIQIASLFIIAIVSASLVSRVLRSTEVRIESVEYDAIAGRFLSDAIDRHRPVRIIASRPNGGSPDDYTRKLENARRTHHLPDDPVLFLEVKPGDASEFTDILEVSGAEVGGHRVLRCTSPAIPNAIAGLLRKAEPDPEKRPRIHVG